MPTFLGDDDAVPCVVVVNDDKQYSIWPSARDIPLGWSEEGFKGARRDCLEHIAQIWPEPTA